MKIAGEKQIEQALANNAYLKLSDSRIDIVGTNNLAKRTHTMYRTLLEMLDRFLLLIGEGECRLILHPMQPSAAMPIKPENVALFLKFKSGTKGDLLQNSSGQQIKDIFGNPVRCEGTWTAPMNVTRFVSAVNRLHQLRNHMGQYTDKCPNCLALPHERRHIGCKAHEPRPCFRREGNPIQDGSFLISYKGILKTLRKTYKVKGNDQFLPNEVRLIIDHLSTTNDIVSLQTLTMMMIGIKLFLRYDELHNIHLDDIPQELFKMNGPGMLESIVINIVGKADRTTVSLALHVDHDCPEFCPIRLLLSYLFLSGIRTGRLFPNEDTLKCPPDNRQEEQELADKVFNARIKSLVEKAPLGLPKGEKKIGTHSLRKTGYLFALWGGGDIESVRTSARHATHECAQTYARDCEAIKVLTSDAPNQHVSRWKAAKILSPANLKTVVNSGNLNKRYAKPLPQLAIDFVVGLEVDVTSQPAILKAARAWRCGKTDEDSFASSVAKKAGGISKEVQAEIVAEAKRWVNKKEEIVREEAEKKIKALQEENKRLRGDHGAMRETDKTHDVVQRPEREADVLDGQEGPAQKKRKTEEPCEFEGYQRVSELESTEEQVAALRDLNAKIPEQPKKMLSSAAYKFVCRALRPNLACLENCFGNDVNEMAKVTPRLRFNKCCKGKKGEPCSYRTNPVKK